MNAGRILAQTLDALKRGSSGYRKEKIKQLVGALGHAPGWAQKPRAWRQAMGSKRVDRIAPSAVATLASAGCGSLHGRRVMEFGTGHLLSEAVVFWLAGAREVVATDYFPILDLGAARWALTSADRNAVVESISAVEDRAAVGARLAELCGLRPWTLPALAALGIDYRAPVDAALPIAGLGAFDLITSLSVLEHVPGAAAGAILRHLNDALAMGGVQHHHIHLEDHRDLVRAPFAFLGADDDYQPSQCDARGNRLRASDWLALAAGLPGTECHVVARAVNEQAPLPARRDPAFDGYDETDLRTAGIGLLLKRIR